VSEELSAFLRREGIRDERVLRAFAEVRRELFVPERYRPDAEADHPLPIGCGQTISQPLVVAYMTERLRLAGAERVLEVGTGSGYQTAVLAHLAEAEHRVTLLGLLDRAPLLAGENAEHALVERLIIVA